MSALLRILRLCTPRRRPAAHEASVLLGVLALIALAGCSERRPDVLVLMVDTLRADALSSYAEDAPKTPTLDRMAREGVLYEDVVAPSSWTKTSMASIWTSRAPSAHGVRGVRHGLPERLVPLAEHFRRAGYRTVGVNTNPWLRKRFGFDAGFDHYESGHFTPAQRVNARALALLRRFDALSEAEERPLFLYLHYMDVHAPYSPGARFFDAPPLELPGRGPVPDQRLERLYRKERLDGPRVRERARALYEAEVRELDAALGELFGALRRSGLLEDAVLAVTSDHGEAFGEHGKPVHGWNYYPEVYAVPLLIRAPGRVPEGLRVEAQMRSIDLAPTLLRLAGLDAQPSFQGKALPLRTGAHPHRLAEGAVGLNDRIPELDYLGLVSERYLYVRERRHDRVELYDLAADPAAQHDLGREHPAAERLAEREPESARHTPHDVELDSEVREELRALGYLGGED